MKPIRFVVAASLAALSVPASAQTAPKVGDQPEARNMALVGYHDLQGRSAYQPTIHNQNGRWIAYIGHHGGTDDIKQPMNSLTGRAEDNGTSIIDVTDPKSPKYLRHLPGEPGTYEAGGAQMTRVCDGKTLPKADRNKTYMLRTFGNQGHEIWDVTVPENPSRIAFLGGLKGTHKNWWECDTGIAYLVSGVEGWRTRRMTQVYDLSDPANPRFIRNFGLAGQQPGAPGAAPTELHGMISTGPAGNRIYFGYGTNKNGIAQIVDRVKLVTGAPEPTPANLNVPQISRINLGPTTGAHSTLPLLGMQIAEFAKDKDGGKRDILMIVNESLVNECQEQRQMVWFADITHEATPFIISNWTVPEPSGNFCTRGGRFGAHSVNENMTSPWHRKLAFVSFFNAGVRAIDVRNPYQPKEVGFFIPPITKNTDKRCIKVNNQDRCKVAIQTNNVEVDDRGYVYIVDRANTGMHILEMTGDARQIAAVQR